jgi:hypothetical protein
MATRQYKTQVRGAEVGIDGNDRGTHIKRREIKHSQFTAIGNHDAEAVAVAETAPLKVGPERAGSLMELAVGSRRSGVRVDQENSVGVFFYLIEKLLADAH